MPSIPSYRRRSADSDRAVVTLTDSVTKKRRMYYLGPYDAPESREQYHRIIAAWEGSGRRLPGVEKPSGMTQGCVTVTELCLAYWTWMKGAYEPQSLFTHKDAIRLVRMHYGSEPADSFGPNKLRDLRVAMVRDRDWSRTYANRQCKRIGQMFKWGAAREMVPASVYDGVRLLEPLRRGELGSRENAKRQPVDFGLVERTIPHLNDTVAAMVRVQMATGMRPCALTIMRPCDLDRASDVWVYTPHAPGREGVAKYAPVMLGPRAQRALIPFLNIDQFEQVFASYTTNSYRRVITRACDRHGLERWTPYQLRHAVLTRIEKTHDSIASSLVAGHSSAMMTESAYIHRDRTKLMEVVREVG